MTRIKKGGMSSKVYQILRDRIADYRFQPGHHINVENLTRELGVSRVPVWEAIRRLEQEGLLGNIPNRGVFLVGMTLEKAFEMFQVRQALEELAGRLAIPHMDPETLRKIARCLEEQVRIVEKGDLVGYSRLDYEFHNLIYQKSRNSFLYESLNSIKFRMQPISMRIMPILFRLYQDHLEILKGFQAKDPGRVARAFRRHNLRVLKQIQAEMRIEAQMIDLSRQMKKSTREN